MAEEIIDFLNDQEWKGVSASETGRKVQQYGFEYDYLSRKGTDYKKADEIPEQVDGCEDGRIERIGLCCK